MPAHNFEDITGERFDKLVAISYDKEKRKWLCQCDCGNTVYKRHAHLNIKDRKHSCGCENQYKFIDITNQRFGKLVAKYYIKENGTWMCECDCGNKVEKKSGHLRGGYVTSCGCNSKDKQIDITGQRFGLLVATKYLGDNKWLCQCDCGNKHIAMSHNLRQLAVTSCGCNNPSNFIDIKGKQFNHLIPLNYCGKGIWECICDCGNITYQNSYDIRFNRVVSCGCNKQKGLKQEALYNTLLKRSRYKIVEKDREVLNGLELDIYIPEKKLAIEFNGNYWHSSKLRSRHYHQQKTIDCAKQGIQLIHFFEYEWDNVNVREKILSYIYKKLDNCNNIIYARNTIIKELNYGQVEDFINKYHIQNSIRSSINLGCFFNNELIGVMTFGKPRFNKEYAFELYRLCWKDDVVVLGGTEKLFSYFLNHYNPTSIITYCNISKFTGNVYTRLGFKPIQPNPITEPNYIWISHDGKTMLSRYQTQKHKLIEKDLGTVEQTEDEIMGYHQYFKVYDSGNLKLEWRK